MSKAIDHVATAIFSGDLTPDEARKINASDGFTFDADAANGNWQRHENVTLTPAALEAAIAEAAAGLPNAAE